MKEFIIGIDAGGTKTRACAYRIDSNTPIAEAFTGCGNPASAGESAVAEIVRAAEEVCASFDGICVFAAIGAAGSSAQIGGRPAREILTERLRTLPCMKNAGIAILPDAELALYANFDPSPDAVSALVISGTGSAVFAFSGERIVRAGGWGNILGDGGSGYHAGLLFLRYLTRLMDRGERIPQELLPPVLSHLEDLRPGIVDLVYRQPKSAVAALAPHVVSLAEFWEPARHILSESASALADDTASVFRQAPQTIRSLAYTGGFITNCGLFRELFLNELKGRLPDILIRPSEDPALGVIRLFDACRRSL